MGVVGGCRRLRCDGHWDNTGLFIFLYSRPKANTPTRVIPYYIPVYHIPVYRTETGKVWQNRRQKFGVVDIGGRYSSVLGAKPDSVRAVALAQICLLVFTDRTYWCSVCLTALTHHSRSFITYLRAEHWPVSPRSHRWWAFVFWCYLLFGFVHYFRSACDCLPRLEDFRRPYVMTESVRMRPWKTPTEYYTSLLELRNKSLLFVINHTVLSLWSY